MARFKPGQSGNKNGRPKGRTNKTPSQKDFEEAVLRQSLPTLDKMIALLHNENTSEAGKINIAKSLLTWTIHVLEERKKEKDLKKPTQNTITETTGNVTPIFSTKAVDK